MSADADTSAPAHLSGRAALLKVLSHGPYRRLFVTSTTAMATQWMQRIGLAWIMWELTHSTTWLGLLAMAELAPGLIFGPIGGVLSDRLPRKKVVLASETVLCGLSVITGLVVFFSLINPVLLFLLTMAAGTTAALQQSARSLLLRDVTPKDCIPTGMSMTAISVNVTRFLGPAIAGPLVIWPGPAVLFWSNAAVALWMIVTVSGLVIPASNRSTHSEAFTRQLWEGLKLSTRHQIVTPVLLIFATTAFLVRPVYELMPAFADRLFGGDAQDYSFLIMGVGIGAVVGAIIVTLKAPPHPAMMFFWSSLAASLALVAFSATGGMMSATLAAAVLGFFMCISAATSQLVMILEADEAVSGRMLSLWGALMRGAPALGALLTGAILDLWGYRIPLFASGLIAASATVLAIFLFLRASRAQSPVAENS